MQKLPRPQRARHNPKLQVAFDAGARLKGAGDFNAEVTKAARAAKKSFLAVINIQAFFEKAHGVMSLGYCAVCFYVRH